MNSSPLLVQRLARWAYDTYWKIKIPFLSSLIWGLLAYTFAFTNKLLNHDEAGQLFGKGSTISSGRWGLSILDNLLPNFSMPWIYGVMTIVLIGLGVCIIVRLFDLRSRLVQVLLAGSIVVFPSVIGLFGYMFTSSSYAVSFLLAVAAVWCIRQMHLPFSILALGMMVFSLSIYQSYISVAAGLLVVLLIQDLLKGDKALPVLKRGIFYVFFLLLSLAGYYLATQILMQLRGISFNEYAADAVNFSLSDLPQRFVLAYTMFLRYFTWGTRGLAPTSLSRYCHLLLGLLCGVLLMLWLLRQKKADTGRVALLILLILMLPLAINCMFLITPDYAVHTLVLYGFVNLYILGAVLINQQMTDFSDVQVLNTLRRLCLNLAVIFITVVIIVNTYVANAAFLNLHLRYENAYAFYTALLSQIQQIPEFQEDTKLAVVGSYNESYIYEYYFKFIPEITGVTGFKPDSYSYSAFLNYYLGLAIPTASAEEVALIQQTEQFQNMPVYPYYGSTAVIGDTIVVKLS